jgi:hypothetical protein
MLRLVDLVRTNVSEEANATIIRLTRIGELGTTLAVTSNSVFFRSVRRFLVAANVTSTLILVTLMTEAMLSSEISALTSHTA